MRVDLPQPKARARRTWMAGLTIAVALAVAGALAGATAARHGNTRKKSGTLTALAHWLDPTAVRTDVPTLTLDIKFRHLKALEDRRALWVQSGSRMSAAEASTTAQVRLAGRTLDVTVALAGSPQDIGPFPIGRLRIAVKGEGELFGCKKLLLDDPERPEVLREVLFYQALEHAGVLAPRVQALQLVVNGKAWGTALAIEQPSVESLGAHHRADGVLVGWDPTLQPGGDEDAVPWLDPRQVQPTVEELRRIAGTPLADQATLATQALRDLLQGKRPAEQVVDVPRTAHFLALCELWGMATALQWHATRWVQHPVTLQLEPFVRLPSGHATGRVVDGLAMAQALLASPVLRAAYEAALRDEASRMDGALLVQMSRGLTTRWPALADVDVQAVGRPVLARARQVLDAPRLAFVDAPAGKTPELPLPVAALLPFAQADQATHTLTVPTGTWLLPGSTVLPEGWSLRLQAGAQLRFPAGAWLVVHGPLLAEGTAAQPVALAGMPDTTGKAAAWGGVLVQGGHGTRLVHVTVRDAGGRGRAGWQPGAALVLVDGDARLEDVDAQDLGDGAALRTMATAVQVLGMSVRGMGGTGLVLEHGKVDVQRVTVAAVGGDGIDLTDATGTVQDVRVTDAAGAAIRAGQGSDVVVQGLVGDKLATGLVARDGAVLRASRVQLTGLRHLGLLAYNQHAGEATTRLEARGLQLPGGVEAHLCTGGAAVTVDGQARECTAVSVQQLVAAGIARR